jgi:hypothetical protein
MLSSNARQFEKQAMAAVRYVIQVTGRRLHLVHSATTCTKGGSNEKAQRPRACVFAAGGLFRRCGPDRPAQAHVIRIKREKVREIQPPADKPVTRLPIPPDTFRA